MAGTSLAMTKQETQNQYQENLWQTASRANAHS